ncbi:MAG: hypothetical protein RR357_00230 [Clostridia bacterium]
MRRLLFFLIICIALVFFGKADLASFNSKFDGEYVVYSTEKSDTKAFAVAGITVFRADFIEQISGKNEVLGETITLSGSKDDIPTILNRLYTVYHTSETIGDIYIVYGYSPKLKRTQFINRKPVNLQITYHNGTITISNPINLGSF